MSSTSLLEDVGKHARDPVSPRAHEGSWKREAERATPVVHGLRIRMVDRGNETSDFRTASSGLLGTSAEGREDGYLVDPASSHMLVSKIKPCMSKYKRL